ncbi:succinate dehydrogenase assembly factor 2, mitochondrial-like [Homarus americanus]|uniref:Succinate dehydrogenase assembly factor 2, mitochondrial n=1 Tax=Homarus americanus TaxID=6706 RepID=A0A8J5JMI6_HOMAM|nr:succinate dehydrogenase assembly factor 2, mitochondrial-like [Homarus americanus]KAG7160992.1 Succinate dehydrogenase assembly factor 2-like [Homarus americanus]
MATRAVHAVRNLGGFIHRTLPRHVTVYRFYSDGDMHAAPPHIVEPTIPPYEEKVGEPIHMKKARLQYQSRKRGMLENGLILGTFAHKYLDAMNEKQLSLYDRLINLPSNDWEIFYWATGVRPTPPEFDNEIMTMLKDFVKNEDRENRTLQPNLH